MSLPTGPAQPRDLPPPPSAPPNQEEQQYTSQLEALLGVPGIAPLVLRHLRGRDMAAVRATCRCTCDTVRSHCTAATWHITGSDEDLSDACDGSGVHYLDAPNTAFQVLCHHGRHPLLTGIAVTANRSCSDVWAKSEAGPLVDLRALVAALGPHPHIALARLKLANVGIVASLEYGIGALFPEVLGGAPRDAEEAEVIAATFPGSRSRFAGLTSLHLEGVDMGIEAAELLAAACTPSRHNGGCGARLRRLVLSGNKTLGDLGLRALLKPAPWAAPTSGGQAAAAAAAAEGGTGGGGGGSGSGSDGGTGSSSGSGSRGGNSSSPFPALRTLRLASCALTFLSVKLVAASPVAQNLRALDLGYNDFVRRGRSRTTAEWTASKLGEIVRKARFPALRTLRLDNCCLGSAGVMALGQADAATFPALRHLTLEDNSADDRALLSLANAPFARILVSLDLRFNTVGKICLARVTDESSASDSDDNVYMGMGGGGGSRGYHKPHGQHLTGPQLRSAFPSLLTLRLHDCDVTDAWASAELGCGGFNSASGASGCGSGSDSSSGSGSGGGYAQLQTLELGHLPELTPRGVADTLRAGGLARMLRHLDVSVIGNTAAAVFGDIVAALAEAGGGSNSGRSKIRNKGGSSSSSLPPPLETLVMVKELVDMDEVADALLRPGAFPHLRCVLLLQCTTRVTAKFQRAGWQRLEQGNRKGGAGEGSDSSDGEDEDGEDRSDVILANPLCRIDLSRYDMMENVFHWVKA